MVRRDRPHRGLEGRPGRQDRPGHRLLPGLLRHRVGQPGHRRRPRPHLPPDGAGGAVHRALPRGGRGPGGHGAHRRGRALRPRRRPRRGQPVAGVAAVPQPAVLRHQRRPLQPRHRLLRLRAALREVRGRLAVRGGGHRAHRHRRRPLPQRRHPLPDADAEGDAPGQGPPVGAAGGAGPAEGGRVLPPALRAGVLQPGGRRRGRLHRRQGPAPRPQPAGADQPVRLRPVPRQHPAPGLGPARDRGRRVGAHLGGHRRRLPGRGAEVPGAAHRVHQGAALHPAQHHRHPRRLQPAKYRGPRFRGRHHPHRGRPRPEPGHHPQHPPLGPADRPRVVQAAAGDPELLPDQRRRRRPLPDRRRSTPRPWCRCASSTSPASRPSRGSTSTSSTPTATARSSPPAPAWRPTATPTSA